MVRRCLSVISVISILEVTVAQDIPEATKVRVRLEQQLSSATAEEGQPVQFAVSDDVRIDDVVVIPHDAVVNGTVVQAVGKRRMGRTGKLDFSIDTIVLPEGGKIPVRYSVVKKEGGSHAVSTGIITAGVAVVFWPAAPFVLLRKGKDTVFNKGMAFDVFTDRAYALKGAAPRVTTSSTPAKATTSNDQGAALNNENIIALKKAGYSDDLILWRIGASSGSYRLDTQSMIDLKNTGLSDEVIRAMTKASKAQNERSDADVAVAKPTPAARTTDAKVVIAKPEIVSPSSSVSGITVRFTSTPSNAEIDVDGNYWGSTPTADLKRLQAGTHTITVRKSGYRPWERKIELAAGDDRTVNAELEVDPTKPRISGLN